MADQRRGTYAEAIARLAFAQKGSRNAPAYSRWVNRPLGRRFAALAYVAGLTPGPGHRDQRLLHLRRDRADRRRRGRRRLLGVLVAVLLVIGYALDSADGQLARLRGGGTRGASGSTTSPTPSRTPACTWPW